jgi:hypothetical protein
VQTTPEASAKPQESRPASVWPTSTRPGELGGPHTAFDASRFDDPALDRARQVQRVAELYDLCQPTLVLRVVLFVQLGVAAGGLAAVVLSVVFRLMERQGFTARIPVGIDHLPALVAHVDQASDRLDLSQEQRLHLHLACEELFVHIAGSDESSPEQSLALRITHQEEELRVEMIHGKRLDSVDGIAMPDNLLTAEPADLDRLGLALFGSIVHDLHQAVISGNTYIWFRLE